MFRESDLWRDKIYDRNSGPLVRMLSLGYDGGGVLNVLWTPPHKSLRLRSCIGRSLRQGINETPQRYTWYVQVVPLQQPSGFSRHRYLIHVELCVSSSSVPMWSAETFASCHASRRRGEKDMQWVKHSYQCLLLPGRGISALCIG